jgi:hypothetical protein
LHGAQGQVSCLAKRRSRAVAMNPLEEAGAARARGTERFKAGDIDGARSDYLRAVAVVCEAGGLRQRQDARELLLPCLSNLAMCCVKTERYREAVEHGASAIALGSACRLAPGIAAKAALRAAQAARAMEDAARARRFLCTARRWARRAHGDVLDAVEKEAVELVVRVRHRVVADRLAALVEACRAGRPRWPAGSPTCGGRGSATQTARTTTACACCCWRCRCPGAGMPSCGWSRRSCPAARRPTAKSGRLDEPR